MVNYSLNAKVNYEEEVHTILTSNMKDRKDVISVEIGSVFVDMTKSLYNLNLLMMRPFYYFGVDIDESSIFMYNNIRKHDINSFINDKILNVLKENYNVTELKTQLSLVINDLVNLSATANGKIGNSISLYDIIDLFRENKEFAKLVKYKIDTSKSISDSESELNRETKRLVEIMGNSDKDLSVYIKSGVGIKPKQLRETVMSIGYKPDVFGDIIPIPINNSLIGGMAGPVEYYVASASARKAIITNFSGVSKSGYLTRKISLFMMDNKLANDVYDCGTTNYLSVEVTNKHMLTNLNGRFYLDTGELKCITKNDDHLIGLTLQLRSPTKCAMTHKYRTCKVCYGKLYKTNDIFNIGLIATLHLTSRFTQSLLSTKHMMKISTDAIIWEDEVKKYFNILKSHISFNSEVKTKKMEIIITDNDINGEIETNKFITGFTIIDNGVEHKLEFDKQMYNDEIIEMLSVSQTPHISIMGAKLDDFKLSFKVRNQEFSKILNKILKLVDTRTIDEFSTIDSLYAKFIDLVEKNDTNVNSVHVELILSNLIRSRLNMFDKYDFSGEENFEDYILVRLSDAITYKSQLMGISFERMKKQIETPSFYSNKGRSVIESLYT